MKYGELRYLQGLPRLGAHLHDSLLARYFKDLTRSMLSVWKLQGDNLVVLRELARHQSGPSAAKSQDYCQMLELLTLTLSNTTSGLGECEYQRLGSFRPIHAAFTH
jgi:hypothetical protein